MSKIIELGERMEFERLYLARFWNRMKELRQESCNDEFCNRHSVEAALEIMDFAVLAFRESGDVTELNKVALYTLAKAEEELVKSA